MYSHSLSPGTRAHVGLAGMGPTADRAVSKGLTSLSCEAEALDPGLCFGLTEDTLDFVPGRTEGQGEPRTAFPNNPGHTQSPCVGPRSVFLMVSWKSLISTDHTQLYSTTISGSIATCPLT